MSLKRRNKKKATFTNVASMAKTQEAALAAMQEEHASEDEEDKRISQNVFKMIDQGTGTIEDLWAPPRMKIMSDYIELGDEALSICTVSNWPTSLSYGWLNMLLEDPSLAKIKIDVSMHIHPVRKDYALKFMNDKKISAESSRDAESDRGKHSESAMTVYDDQICTAQMVYNMLKNNKNENLYQVSITFGIYGHEEIKTDAVTHERYVVRDAKEDVIANMETFKKALAKNSKGGFAVKPLLHQQREGIKSLLPWGYGGLHSFQNMYTSALASCYPFTHGELQVDDGILYGVNPATNQPYFFNSFDRNWVKNYSTVVIGSSGSGKSETVKAMLGRYAVRGTQVFVIDPAINTKGEYTNLATSLDGDVIDFGGKSGVYMNPFELQRPSSWHQNMTTDQAEAESIYKDKKEYLVGLFDIMSNNYIKENRCNVELSAFSKVMGVLVDRLYQWKGINITRKCWDFTQWDCRKMPKMSDFYKLLLEYQKILATYTTFEKVKSWGASKLAPNGALVGGKHSASEIIMLLYYRQVINSNGVDLWGRSALDVVMFASEFVEEYALSEGSENYSEKSALFSGNKQADLSKQCIVFRFGNVSDEMKEIATYLTFELIYSRINAVQNGSDVFSNHIVAMDECWKLLSSHFARSYIMKLSREGRKLNTGLWVISQKYSDFQGENQVLFDQSETKIILSLSGDEVDKITDDLDLSPSLAALINSDKTATQPGLGIMSVAGKKHATVAFYFVLTSMEASIGDTTDATKPPLTSQQIIDMCR